MNWTSLLRIIKKRKERASVDLAYGRVKQARGNLFFRVILDEYDSGNRYRNQSSVISSVRNMGRHLQQEDSANQFQDYRPGCLSGLLHILDYHHWKIALHKKHHGRRTAICCLHPKTISLDHAAGKAQNLLDAEADNFEVKQHPAKVGTIDKRIKALITEEMSKEENHNHSFLEYPAQSKFQRTNSIHRLEPSDYRLGKINTEWTNPIIILQKNANTCTSGLQFSSLEKTTGRLVTRNKSCDFCDSMNVEGSIGQYQSPGKHRLVKSDRLEETLRNENEMDAKHLNREIFHHQVQEYADVLEIFKVKKELFFKILQDPDNGVSKQFTGQQISNRKVQFTKSGSFPVANVSHVRYLRPSTLEHKQNETWTFLKGEKLVSRIQVPKPDAVRSQKGYNEKTAASLVDQGVGCTVKDKTSVSSSSHQVYHQRWNRLVVGRLQDIKQRIKQAIKESKERNKSHTDGFLQIAPTTCAPSTYGKETPKCLETSTSQENFDNFTSSQWADGFDLSSSKLCQMRRTASLNESLDRYAQLFESSFRKEAKLPQSKSLKLRNESSVSLRERAPKFFRRISSLSDLESFCSLINEVVHDSEKAVRTEADSYTSHGSYNFSETNLGNFPVDADKQEPLDAVVESEVQKNMEKESESNSGIEYGLITIRVDEEIARTSELGENTIEPANVTSIPQEDQKIGSPVNPTVDFAQPSLVSEPEPCLPDDITNTAKCPIAEGLESNPIVEANSFFVLQNGSGKDSLPCLCSEVNHEKNHSQHFELDNNEASLNYVKDVLQQSGFIENESLGKWYSLDQPLDPSLFKEMEAVLHQEVQCSEEFGGKCDHQLLFDLISAVILEMYERSLTYFPRAFSFNHSIRSMPKGHHVLKVVWARISWYLSFSSEMDQSLDDIVAQDLSKDDCWMTHQFETECVALELEELIFDELLDEVICS